MALNILLSGGSGAMGGAIRALADADPGTAITAVAHRDQPFPDDAAGDVVVDFSTPDQTLACLDFCLPRGLPLVVGTTGFDAGQAGRMRDAAGSIAVCRAANFSVGVAVLRRLVTRAARELGPDFEAEILDLHHRHKADAPSGTALDLGQAVHAGRRDDAGEVFTRHGQTGPRPDHAVGYQALRGGDVPGEHTVYFLGDGERLELTHRAGDRAIFARGALRAARWLVGRPPGLYALEDVLGG